MIGKSETIFPALPTMKTYQPVRSDRHEKTLIALFLFSTLPVQATGLSEKRANRPAASPTRQSCGRLKISVQTNFS